MSFWPKTIMGPLYVHGARTECEYADLQARAIAVGRAVRPALNWRDPWVVDSPQQAFVSGGKWLVRCSCRNAPSASIEWSIARCFECGAVYTNIEWPDNAIEIERVLCLRPHPSNRAWIAGETVDDLKDENVAHKIVDPDEKEDH